MTIFAEQTALLSPANWWLILLAISYLLAVLSVPSVLLERRGKPHTAVSWLLVLFALPGLGLFLWWAIGRKHLERQRRRRRKAAAKTSDSMTRLRGMVGMQDSADSVLLPIQCMPAAEAEWVFPPTVDNRLKLLIDASEVYPALEATIRAAREHVHVAFYIWNDDETGRYWRDVLAETARRGVKVRLLVDGLGSRSAVRRKMFEPLVDAGGEVAVFLPLTLFAIRPTINFRNHRKLVIVDGCTGFLGGFNIGDEYRSNWHDLGLQLEGSIVDQLQETFAEDWYFATNREIVTPQIFCSWQSKTVALAEVDDTQAICSLLASGPHTPNNFTHDALFLAITQAKQRIYITTPYLIPEETTLAALRTAVYRGIDVQVLVPAQNDVPLMRWAGRSYYPDLIGAGVRVFEYLPTILHAKSVVIDDDLSIVGSANMDVRSFRLNFEASCLARSKPLNQRLVELFERNLADSQEITDASLQRRSYLNQLTDAAAHLLSPLL